MVYIPTDALAEDSYCFLLTNLSSNAKRDTLWEHFGRFGTVQYVHLNATDGQVLAAAIIVYSSEPSDQLFTQMIYIDSRLVNVQPYDISRYLSEASRPVPANKLSLGGLESPNVFIEEWSTDQFITLDFNLIENYMDIFFNHVDGYYRLRIVYDTSLADNVVLQRYDNMTSLTISGNYPAYYWRSKKPMQKLAHTYYLKDWERVTEIPLDEFSLDLIRHKATINSSSKGPILPGGQYPNHLMKLNMWTVYRLEFEIPLKSSKQFINAPLSPDNLTHEALERELALAISSKGIPRPRYIPDLIHVRSATKSIHVDTFISNLPFEVLYMMEHAFNLKILREYNVDDDFFDKIRNLPTHVCCTFLTLLAAPQKRIYHPEAALNEAYKVSKENLNFEQPVPENYTTVRRLLVTPTSMYPLQPTIEPMNHLQYRFKKYADRFLYVQFTDEDLAPIVPIQSTEDEALETQNDRIYERIYAILKRGLQIGGRTYEYLGSSVQHLRSHGCWFIAPINDFTRTRLLNSMGDLREIETVAVFSSCIGQALQPRLCHIDLDASEIEEIDDYYNNGFDFAPECGKMSPQVAREISSQLDMNYTPSVVKFNLAGARGILVVSNYLTKRKIQLRTSQIRFNSPNVSLEIIKVSKPNRVYLNRRSILLLSSLGVQDYIFRQLMSEELAYWEKYKSRSEDVYHSILNEHFSSDCMSDFQRILDSKFLEYHDPFISNLVISFQNQLLKGLKEDCSLFIFKGARVFAVMDETGTLEPGEVFLQLSDPSEKTLKRKVIEGPCVVYRDSSCSPGDVRIVKAIASRSKLRHYCNVLVYSAHDQRDLLSLCSNDDVDDDNVTVIWDNRLLPRRVNLEPRNYTPKVTPKTLKKITFKEMAKFFTTFISQDTSYLLNNAFIAIADRQKDGILNGDCIYLSQQICRALDFAKTGVYAPINREFRRCPYPDYMERNFYRTYKSQTVVGALYQDTKSCQEKPLIRNHCYYDRRMYVEDMYKYILDARKLKAKYDHSLRMLLARYSIKTEVEFISGHIMDWPKYLGINQRAEFRERIKDAYAQFRKYWRQIFEEPLIHAVEEAELTTKIEAKAAAWYYVTYHPSEYKNDVIYNRTLARFISFPWVVDDFVSHIALKNDARPPSPEQIRAIPQEKIRMYQNNVVVSESEDEEDEDEDNEEEEKEVVKQDMTQPKPTISTQQNEEDDIPEVNIKLVDILRL